MIVLPETAAEGAVVVAARLRRLSALERLYQPSGPISFAANIDVTALKAEPCENSTQTLEALLRAATRGATAGNALETDGLRGETAAVINTFAGPGGKKHRLN